VQEGESTEPLVLFGLGGNLGDPRAQLREAVRRLEAEVAVESRSSLYRTDPIDAPGQPPYLNAVISARSALPPRMLLDLAGRVEGEMGRERGARNAARLIDIDLLAAGSVVIDEPGLTVPHPRMHLRAFVLVPLVEIHPGWMHPVLGSSARQLLEELSDPGEVERLGKLKP